MPLTLAPDFSSTDAEDVHLLRKVDQIDLGARISAGWASGQPAPNQTTWDHFSAYPQPAGGGDVTLDFKPVFNCQQNAATYTGFGVTVNRTTGVVTVGDWPAAQAAPANFIVEVRVTRNGVNPVPADWKPALIRIHLHRSVTQVWMTPSQLSIPRPQATGTVDTPYAFTIRAQFDDGVVGDITLASHYRFNDTSYVSSDGFIRLPASLGVGATHQVGLVTSPAWGSRAAHATIKVLPPWSSAPNMPQATLIDGRAPLWDGTLKPEKTPNILFVGVGYKKEDDIVLDAMTDQIVDAFRTDARFAPYTYFSDSINYWKMLVPSDNRGISVRSEMFTTLVDGQLMAMHLPKPEAPPPTKVWSLENLLYQAGLPTPADVALVKPNPAIPGDMDYSDLVTKFNAIVAPNPPFNAPEERMAEWILLANRTFIDEVDCYPPMAAGSPPAVNPSFDETGLLELHPLRTEFVEMPNQPADLQSFFQHVKAAPKNGHVVTLDDTPSSDPAKPNNPELGNIWGTDRDDRFRYDNRSFIVYIANLPITDNTQTFGRSQQFTKFGVFTRPTILSGDKLKDGGVPVTVDPHRNALILDYPDPAEMEATDDTWETMAHELGHAFHLGDEYGSGDGAPPSDINDLPNLMPFADALKSPGDPTIAVGQLKWNWDRISKAAVVQLPIEEMPDGSYRVYVNKGTGGQFLVGDKVRLRFRDPREGLTADVLTTGVELEVVSTDPNNLSQPTDPLTMTVVIKSNAQIGPDLIDYKPGSILFESVPAPDDIKTIAHPYLSLVPPVSARIMEKVGGAMNGNSCDPTDIVTAKLKIQTPALSDDDMQTVAPNVPAQDRTMLVGAYFGGGQQACSVLHPAGACMMRTHANKTEFCPVCRFLMVDMVDPEQHWRNDRDYAKKFYL